MRVGGMIIGEDLNRRSEIFCRFHRNGCTILQGHMRDLIQGLRFMSLRYQDNFIHGHLSIHYVVTGGERRIISIFR